MNSRRRSSEAIVLGTATVATIVALMGAMGLWLTLIIIEAMGSADKSTAILEEQLEVSLAITFVAVAVLQLLLFMYYRSWINRYRSFNEKERRFWLLLTWFGGPFAELFLWRRHIYEASIFVKGENPPDEEMYSRRDDLTENAKANGTVRSTGALVLGGFTITAAVLLIAGLTLLIGSIIPALIADHAPSGIEPITLTGIIMACAGVGLYTILFFCYLLWIQSFRGFDDQERIFWTIAMFAGGPFVMLRLWHRYMHQ